MKRLALLSVLAIAFTACGSSDGKAATASDGDAFCTAAQVAKADNDALQDLDPTDPAKVKVQLSGAIDSLSTVAAKAPADISATVNKLLAAEEKLEGLLEDNDFDFVKMLATDEGKQLIADDEITKVGDDLDKYLNDKCGIVTDDSVATDDTVATDDSIATDDTVGSDMSIDLGEGEDAINQFLDFYELGTSSKLTDDERACIVDALSDVSGADLNAAIAGNSSEEVQQALGLAFINCNVAVGS